MDQGTFKECIEKYIGNSTKVGEKFLNDLKTAVEEAVVSGIEFDKSKVSSASFYDSLETLRKDCKIPEHWL